MPRTGATRNRFDPLSAPVLRALQGIAQAGSRHDKLVTVCGELASQPIGALALAALGYRSLSVTPSALGPVKAMLLDLDTRKAKKLLDPLIDSPAGTVTIRKRLQAFAESEGLQL
jgi:phosphotransferase system enzyme I (PtsP)